MPIKKKKDKRESLDLRPCLMLSILVWMLCCRQQPFPEDSVMPVIKAGGLVTRWQRPWRMCLLQHSCVRSQGSSWPTRTKYSKDSALNSALEGQLEQLTSITAVQPLPANARGLQRVNASVCKLLRMFFSSLTIRVFPSSRTLPFKTSELWFILLQIKDACSWDFSEAYAMGHASMQWHQWHESWQLLGPHVHPLKVRGVCETLGWSMTVSKLWQ